MAERFKASTRRINQNLDDAIVSVQTGCRAYQVEQAVSNIRERAGLSTEKKHLDKDNYSDDKWHKWRWDTTGLHTNTSIEAVEGAILFSCFHPFTTIHESYTLLLTIFQTTWLR